MVEATNVTQILNALDGSSTSCSEQLLPLVYRELRRLAAQRLTHEKPGQTLQATALVHEAYLRLVDVDHQQRWESRGHFFAAAAEAMRRILVENARRKSSLKRGGDMIREDLDESRIAAVKTNDDLLALDEALDRLAESDAQAVQLVKLRYFSGLTVPQAAAALNISPRSADRVWAYAKAWLLDTMQRD